MRGYRHAVAGLLGLALGSAPGAALSEPAPMPRRIDNGPGANAQGPVQTPFPATALHVRTPLNLYNFDLDEPADPGTAAALPTTETTSYPDTATRAAAAEQPREGSPAGPLDLAYDSLIHRDVAHRGRSATWGLGPQTRLRGFVLDPYAGTEPGTPRSEEANTYRLHGALLEHALRLPYDATVQVTASWLAGSAKTDAAASGGGQSGGSAWSLRTRASLLEQRLRLSLEYAGSHAGTSDPTDGKEQGAADPSGRAYVAAAELRSRQRDSVAWHLGTEYRWVDPRFGSVANPQLDNNNQRIRTFGGLQIDDWQIDVSIDQKRDNLRLTGGSPARQREHLKISAKWNPSALTITPVLGTPRLRLAADIERRRSSPGAAVEHHNQAHRSRKIQLESSFSTPQWRWGLEATGNLADETIKAQPRGVRSAKLRLFADANDETALPLSPRVSWRRHFDSSVGPIDDWRAELATLPLGLNARLKADFKLGYRQRVQSDLDEVQEALRLNASLVWTLQRPTAGSRGLALTMTGSLGGDPARAASQGRDDYALMLSLSSGSPLAGR